MSNYKFSNVHPDEREVDRDPVWSIKRLCIRCGEEYKSYNPEYCYPCWEITTKNEPEPKARMMFNYKMKDRVE